MESKELTTAQEDLILSSAKDEPKEFNLSEKIYIRKCNVCKKKLGIDDFFVVAIKNKMIEKCKFCGEKLK